jgi:hypothetical protein
VTAFINKVLARVSSAKDGEKHYVLRDNARLLGGIQAEAGFCDAEAIAWLLEALPPVESVFQAEQTAAWGLEACRRRPILIPSRTMLTALPDSGGSKAAGRPRRPRSRSSETVRMMLRLLSARTKKPAVILEEVLADNAKRTEPLSRDRMEKCIQFAVERHRKSFHV